MISLLWACESQPKQAAAAEPAPPRNSLLQFGQAHKVSTETFAALLDSLPEVQLIDVRTAGEYSIRHIPGSRNIDVTQEGFTERIRAEVDPQKLVLLYCQRGARSGRAAKLMEKMGYSELYDLEGGFGKWRQAGFPFEAGERLKEVMPSEE